MNIKSAFCVSLSCAFAGLAPFLLFNATKVSSFVDTIVFSSVFVASCMALLLWRCFWFYKQANASRKPLIGEAAAMELPSMPESLQRTATAYDLGDQALEEIGKLARGQMDQQTMRRDEQMPAEI